jgi:hypothetical protein
MDKAQQPVMARDDRENHDAESQRDPTEVSKIDALPNPNWLGVCVGGCVHVFSWRDPPN